MSNFGIILVNKPVGITSFDVVKKIRKLTNIKKVGHTGTLDPFACGLLPVCIGKATRIAGKLSGKDKEYIVAMKLGIKTDTGDKTGRIVEQRKIPELKLKDIEKIIPELLNIKSQVPHKFSAVKVDGKRAYQLAREDKEIKLKSRPIRILGFSVEKFNLPNIIYKTTVSKGTYIRSLTETVAEKLNTIATSVELKRTKIGNLNIEDAIELEKLDQNNWRIYLQSLPDIFKDLQKYYVNFEGLDYFINGRQFEVKLENTDEVMVLNGNNECVGFASIEQNTLKPRIVLI
jgi:tRNA pseudouridine55 synthase